jgi:hypothetical protein
MDNEKELEEIILESMERHPQDWSTEACASGVRATSKIFPEIYVYGCARDQTTSINIRGGNYPFIDAPTLRQALQKILKSEHFDLETRNKEASQSIVNKIVAKFGRLLPKTL